MPLNADKIPFDVVSCLSPKHLTTYHPLWISNCLNVCLSTLVRRRKLKQVLSNRFFHEQVSTRDWLIMDNATHVFFSSKVPHCVFFSTFWNMRSLANKLHNFLTDGPTFFMRGFN